MESTKINEIEVNGVVYVPKEEWVNCIVIKREEF